MVIVVESTPLCKYPAAMAPAFHLTCSASADLTAAKWRPGGIGPYSRASSAEQAGYEWWRNCRDNHGNLCSSRSDARSSGSSVSTEFLDPPVTAGERAPFLFVDPTTNTIYFDASVQSFSRWFDLTNSRIQTICPRSITTFRRKRSARRSVLR